MRKTSLIVASVVSAISCIFLLSPADAQKRGGTPPTGVSNSQDLPAGAVFGECAFPVRFEQNGKAGTITLPGGRFIFTSPGLDATLTNLNDTTKSVTLNITGTFHQSTDSNGETVTLVVRRVLAPGVPQHQLRLMGERAPLRREGVPEAHMAAG